jgi:mRNA interferase RelE/StbE
MTYESEFTPTFLKLLKKLDRQIRERVLKAIEEVLSDPRRGSRLVFAKHVCFKWRIANYRMIYTIDEKRKVVTFIVVHRRSRVYKRYGL